MDESSPKTTPTRQSLAGLKALVTGSSSGIGRGMAHAFASAGADVMLNGIEDDNVGRPVADEIADAFDVETRYHRADLSTAAGCAELIDATQTAFGQIDILVNNAGVQHVSPVEDFPDDKWNLIIALNRSAAFHATKLVFKGMKERGYGRIINLASAHGLVASAYKSAYVSAKHGVVGLTKTLALEGGPHGVTANAICPGYVWTPLVANQVADQAKAHGISEDEVASKVFLTDQPTGKFVTVEEIGELAVLLASEAGASINGAALQIDGGWTAH